MSVFLALTVIAFVPGLVGVVVHGVLYLLFIGIPMFVVGLCRLAFIASRRRPARWPPQSGPGRTGAVGARLPHPGGLRTTRVLGSG
ncbi:hypothetical protein ACFQ6N_29575 [Kitasatospora sp. NPDC056446]|uniref:hypothetical protein n=1 Tax=Kitasatospora sp. NPDC056446 TaxID=3345819 RepID=UPI0036CE1E41